MSLSIVHEVGSAFCVRDGEIELLRCTYVSHSPRLESPRPYLHPVRTRAGRLVSLFRPWDHVWHRGIAWSLPVVGDDNFWGGPTYTRDQGYVQLPNNGSQEHRALEALEAPGGTARFAHTLDWITEGGERIATERRELTARILDDDAWALTFDTAMTNVAGRALAIGSPTTRGRDNAGYGGLFWRGPRSFTGGQLVTESGTGSGDDVRGQRHAWMGFTGTHDETAEESLLVMLDAAENPHHPPQWFARSEDYACLNPAPFFSKELEVGAGETVRFRYGVGIADAGAERAPGLAASLRAVLA
ncbi:MAG: PmoA family protein [Actinomycetota bacterium]